MKEGYYPRGEFDGEYLYINDNLFYNPTCFDNICSSKLECTSSSQHHQT